MVSPRCLMRSAFCRALLMSLWLAAPALGSAATAFIEGDVSYLQRVMPPADAVLVVTLEDTSRADAPAAELARTQMRLAGGPPYSWRLGYDTGLLKPQQRVVVRARIMAADALWMSTDQAVPAFDAGAPIALRLVMAQQAPPPQDLCASAKTQGAMNQCAYDDFLQASAADAASLAALSKGLPPSQRTKLLRTQSSWLTYRTAACDFESRAAEGGSLKPFVNWRCAARMTRQHTADRSRLAGPEGDAARAGARR